MTLTNLDGSGFLVGDWAQVISDLAARTVAAARTLYGNGVSSQVHAAFAARGVL